MKLRLFLVIAAFLGLLLAPVAGNASAEPGRAGEVTASPMPAAPAQVDGTSCFLGCSETINQSAFSVFVARDWCDGVGACGGSPTVWISAGGRTPRARTGTPSASMRAGVTLCESPPTQAQSRRPGHLTGVV